MPTYAVILAAAGRSSRFCDKHYKKHLAPLAGQSVWLHAANQLLAREDVKQFILVVSHEDQKEFAGKLKAHGLTQDIELCLGGEERVDSIRNALRQVRTDIDLVAIHDAARPCLASAWINRVFSAAAKRDAAILAVPVASTLKRGQALKREQADTNHPNDSGPTDKHQIVETINRSHLWAAQTPQVFQRELLLKAYAALQPGDPLPTDDAQLVERIGKPVLLVEGSPLNLKITTQDDLKLAELILGLRVEN
jgi:2-C-methyl-D-erythritol 4-phosphate cytidylyltransferase